MKRLIGFVLVGFVFGALSLTMGAARADDAPAWELRGSLAAASDYRFRGISQSDRSPAAQGSLNLVGPDGFYIGSWASNVDFTSGASGNPYTEVDIYGGKHIDLWGLDWNIEPYYYAYPAAIVPAGAPQVSYFELIDQFSKSYGPVSLTATYAWSPNLGSHEGSGHYLAGNASYTINDWLSISATFGHQWALGDTFAAAQGYSHGDVGVTGNWKSFSLDLRYGGTDMNAAQCAGFRVGTAHACSGGFAATLSYDFKLLP